MLNQQFRFNHEAFSEELARYSEHDRRTIDAYFAVIALTRKTRKLAEGVIRGELKYWSKYPVELVLQALREHVRKNVGKKENYTRGILRNMATTGRVLEGGMTNAVNRGSAPIGERGHFGEADRGRYIGEDDPLPI